MVIGKRYAETRWGLFSDPNSQVAYMRQQITGDVRPALARWGWCC